MDTNPILVIKCDPQGNEIWRYPGRMVEHTLDFIRVEAFYNRPDTPFHGILLGQGDLFVETYFYDRWYNIMEIHDRSSGRLKGWYCNVTCPATISSSQVSYRDLALDLLVYPDGNQLILDEEEFSALALEPDVVENACQALEELQRKFRDQFDKENPPQLLVSQ